MPQLWSSAQLAEHEFPDPAFLVEPMIPQGGLVILHGKPGVGKTQFVLTLAHAINNGLPFLSRWPTRQGPVVVIQADMTGQIQQDRVVRIINNVNIADTYWVVEEDGRTPSINVESMPILQRNLVQTIQELNPVLVVWDTLRKIHRLPENASESPIIVYDAARAVAPKATHLFVHHNRKASRDPNAPDMEDEAFMGNQQWKGACDATMSLEELGTVPKRLLLTFHKARTASDIERRPIILELDMKTIILMPTED